MMVGLAAGGAMADPPIPPNPPVQHTNQGRNVDQRPIDIAPKPLIPILSDGIQRGIWDPTIDPYSQRTERLRAPDLPGVPIVGADGDAGSFSVTPAPSTLGLLALGGLALGRRRR